MMVAPRLNLGGGGSEKQTIELANGFARNGCEVTILLTDKKMDMTSPLSNGVKIISYGPNANFFSRFRFVYKTAKKRKPDILYSRFWTTKPAVIFAGKILGIKTVAVEVSNIKKSLKRWPPIVRNAIGFCQGLLLQNGGYGNSAFKWRKKKALHNSESERKCGRFIMVWT